MGLFSARRLGSACVVSAAAIVSFAAPSAASAAEQCSGGNIVAAGSSLQKLAQKEVWQPDFNTSKNAAACNGEQGSKGKPTLSYESIGSGAGLEDWGVNKHAFEAGRVAIVTTDEPVNGEQKTEIEGNETTKTAETVQTIPVLQGAVAIIVNLPTGCTSATSKNVPGRLALNNTTLQKIWVGTIKKWSEIKDDADKITCGTKEELESSITRVARLDQSGTTHIFKKYLGLINKEKFETEKAESKSWNEISEGTENTTWPKAAEVVRPTKTGGGALVSKVAETPGSLGYANLADARSNGGFSKTGVGGPKTSKFGVEIQHNGLGAKATYADPSTNGDAEATALANCKETKYTNGAGTKFPPKSTAALWNEVTTAATQKKYTLCGLTYDMVLSKYSAYPGTNEGEAVTSNNFELFVLESNAEGGQPLINANKDYEALPTTLLKESREGAKRAAF